MSLFQTFKARLISRCVVWVWEGLAWCRMGGFGPNMLSLLVWIKMGKLGCDNIHPWLCLICHLHCQIAKLLIAIYIAKLQIYLLHICTNFAFLDWIAIKASLSTPDKAAVQDLSCQWPAFRGKNMDPFLGKKHGPLPGQKHGLLYPTVVNTVS